MPETTIHLFLGPEEGNKKKEIKQIEASLTKKYGEPPEIHRFYPFDTEISNILTVLRNGSLFAASKLVIIHNVDEFKKNDFKALAEYCKKPADATVLILLSPKNSLDSTVLTKALPKNAKKMFWELFENQKESWIHQFFRQTNQTISPEAVTMLLELVQNNTADLKNECNKLALFFDDGYTITEEDVGKYIYHSKEENVFTLFEVFCTKNLAATLEILHKLLLSSENNPISILSGLLWQLRRLLEIKIKTDNHFSFDEACKTVGIRGKKNQKTYRNGIQSFSCSDLEAMMIMSAETDQFLRTSKAGIHRSLIQHYFYVCLCAEKKQITFASFSE